MRYGNYSTGKGDGERGWGKGRDSFQDTTIIALRTNVRSTSKGGGIGRWGRLWKRDFLVAAIILFADVLRSIREISRWTAMRHEALAVSCPCSDIGSTTEEKLSGPAKKVFPFLV